MRVPWLCRLPLLGGLLSGMLFPGAAFATDVQITATILLGKGTCSIVSVTPAIFTPALDPLAAPDRTAAGTVTVNCKGLGNKASTVALQRQDTNPLNLRHTLTPSDTIAYSLDLPASTPVANNTDIPITVTATIPGSEYQEAPAGVYTDTVSIEVLPWKVVYNSSATGYNRLGTPLDEARRQAGFRATGSTGSIDFKEA